MTADELKESIFMALGEASMCWDPLPSNQVFDSTRAKEIGDKLVEKIMPILSQCEEMQKVVEAAKLYANATVEFRLARISERDLAGHYNKLVRLLSHLGEGV